MSEEDDKVMDHLAELAGGHHIHTKNLCGDLTRVRVTIEFFDDLEANTPTYRGCDILVGTRAGIRQRLPKLFDQNLDEVKRLKEEAEAANGKAAGEAGSGVSGSADGADGKCPGPGPGSAHGQPPAMASTG